VGGGIGLPPKSIEQITTYFSRSSSLRVFNIMICHNHNSSHISLQTFDPFYRE
jgi:hypothetical protein